MSFQAVLELIKSYGEWVIFLAGIIYAYRNLVKPIRDIQSSTSLLLWSHLVSEHDHFMQLGYCPEKDKKRLCDIHKEYRGRGLNHLADEWEQDILNLPNEPKPKNRRQ